MDINEAIENIECAMTEIDEIGFIDLNQADLEWLAKAKAALEACRELGGR